MADPAAKPRWRKPWSVRDADHIPNGARVIVRSDEAGVMETAARVMKAFGIKDPGARRAGVVVHRSASSASWYHVRLDGDPLATYGFARSDLIHPVPDGVVAFDPAARKAVRRG